MRNAVLWSLSGLLVFASGASAADPELKTEEQKTLYAIGVAVSQGLGGFNLTPAELELVKAGLTDGVLGKEKKVDLQAYGPKIQELQAQRQSAAAAVEKKAGQTFLDTAAAEKGATKTGSGLVMTSPEAVFFAPGAEAALARNSSPAFFSTAACALSRPVCSSWIFGP